MAVAIANKPRRRSIFSSPIVENYFSFYLINIQVHYSNIELEISFYFLSVTIEPLLRDEMTEDYLWETINPVLVEGLTLVK